MTLPEWNEASLDVAAGALLSCCGSPGWVREMVGRRPYPSLEALRSDAEAVWFALPEPEWLRAFACHPRIGERSAELPAIGEAGRRFADWSGSEQRAAQATLDNVASALVEGNRAYERKFGFLYIVFASGRTAPDLLATLNQRLARDRPAELQEAARQQWAIAHLRLGKLFERGDEAR